MKAPDPRLVIAVFLTCAAATITAWMMFADSMNVTSCNTYALPDAASPQSPPCTAIAEPVEVVAVAAETASQLADELVSTCFTVTAYCPCVACCGDSADGITATGTIATQGRTVAVDPFVIPLGSSVIIDGHEYIAEDVGGAIDGNHVEIFFDSHEDALIWGKKVMEVEIQCHD